MAKAIILEPGKEAEIRDIGTDWKSLSAIVGGMIECVEPFGNDIVITVNEEGKILGLPLNRALVENGKVLDIYAGTMVVLRADGEQLVSLTDEQVAFILQRFGKPESVNEWKEKYFF